MDMKKAAKLYANGYNFDYIASNTGIDKCYMDNIIEFAKGRKMSIFRKLYINHKLRKSKLMVETIKAMQIRTSVAYKIYFTNIKNIKNVIKKSEHSANLSEFCNATGIPRFIVFKMPTLKFCINNKIKSKIVDRINSGEKLINMMTDKNDWILLKQTLMESIVIGSRKSELGYHSVRYLKYSTLRNISMNKRNERIRDIINLSDKIENYENLVHATNTDEFIRKIIAETSKI